MNSMRIKFKGNNFVLSRDQSIKYLDLEFLNSLSINYINIYISGAPQQTEDADYTVDGRRLILSSELSSSVGVNDEIELLIHYYGVRDYQSLFYFLGDHELEDKMGRYYHESELCFVNGCWLSYLMMVGAIFEGILYDKLKDAIELDKDNAAKNFGKLLDKAYGDGSIIDETYMIMNSIRKKRNLVHVGCDPDSYPTYTDAMDAKAVLMKEMIRIWIPNGEVTISDFCRDSQN